jgi:hypothetical protein
MVERPLDVEYLQQRYYLAIKDGRELRAPGNRIGRILLRTFWTKDRLKDIKYLGLLRGIALSLIVQNNHVPIINDLFRAIVEVTSGVVVYLDKEWTQKVKQFTPSADRVSFQEHPGCVDELAMHLGVSSQQVRDLRGECSRVNLGSHLCLAAGFEPILNALASWDL